MVILQNNRPAALLREEDGDYLLMYAPDAKPFTPWLPNIDDGEIRLPQFPAFLTPLIPRESRAIILGKRQKFDSTNVLTLAKYSLGTETVGDLTLVFEVGEMEEDSVETPTPLKLQLNLQDLTELPDRVLDLLQKRDGFTGAGGSWPKVFVAVQEQEYLLKAYPDSSFKFTGDQIATLEAASLSAANECGVRAVKSNAVGRFLLVERFDRVQGQPLGIAHLSAGFESPDLYGDSYEKGAKLLPATETREYAKQVMFSWVIGDSQRHKENFALIRGDSGWELSPFYDALPSKFISNDTEDLALTLNGKREYISLKDLTDFGSKCGLSEKETTTFLTQAASVTNEQILPQFPDKLKEPYANFLKDRAAVIEGCNP